MTTAWNYLLSILVFLASGIALIAADTLTQIPAANVPTNEFLVQVFTTLSALGGLGTMAKISALITLLIASGKVGPVNKAVWQRLGPARTLVAPFLGLLAGVAGLGAGGVAVTPALVLIYVVSGGGAVFLHELLDASKGIPGFGAFYKNAIEKIDSALGGNKPATTAAPESQSKGESDR